MTGKVSSEKFRLLVSGVVGVDERGLWLPLVIVLVVVLNGTRQVGGSGVL
jgi:hypothetical protein